jgi:hypothetical protein
MNELQGDIELQEQFYSDPVLFCRQALASWFPKKMPWVHRGILAILLRRTDFLTKFGVEDWQDEPGAVWSEEELELLVKNFVQQDLKTNEIFPLFFIRRDAEGKVFAVDLKRRRFTALIMPRGFAKTTVVNAAVLIKILFQERKVILYVSETGTHAETQLGNIKRELQVNFVILAVFGALVPDRGDMQRSTMDHLEAKNGVVVIARGRGSQVRGLNHFGERPDEIIVDDMEDPESVSTEHQRDKALSWLMADLIPVLPRQNRSATITMMGTLLHREALMMKVTNDPRFTVVRFGALDIDGNPLWPAHMDEAALESERQAYANAGKLAIYYREFLSQLRSDDDAKFKPSYFDSIVQPIALTECVARAIVIDPAISEKVSADSTAIAVVGITSKGLVYLLDLWSKVGALPREQVDKYFELSQRWQCNRHGIEAIAYQTALVHLMREEMFRKHHYFEISEIRHKTKKTERIEGVLQPRFAGRYIRFQRDFPELQGQLLDWPAGGFDESDAFAMAITLLDPFAAQAVDPTKNFEDDEYEPLDYRSMQGAP